jgi:hypothetical protein
MSIDKKVNVLQLGCPPNKRFRIFIRYNSSIRKLFWIEIKKDKSLYFSPGPEKITKFGTGYQKKPGEIISLGDDKFIDLPKYRLRAGLHFSIHPSGDLRLGEVTHKYLSITRITKQELLATIIFQHPSELDIIRIRNKRDIIVNLPIDEERVLWSEIYVSPIKKEKLMVYKTNSEQTNIQISVKFPDNIILIFQFTFAIQKDKQKWPKYTYVIFPRYKG